MEKIDHIAKEDCPLCGGTGYIEVDVANEPYGTGVHQEEDFCSCVVEIIESAKGIIEANSKLERSS